jgi:hypothetical protein
MFSIKPTIYFKPLTCLFHQKLYPVYL